MNDRIKAFCDWADTIEPGKLLSDPGFRQFSDFTDEECRAAVAELRRRAAAAQAEAEALENEAKDRIQGRSQ